MSSSSELGVPAVDDATSPLTVVIIGADDDPVLLRLLAADGMQPRVVRLMGVSSEGRQLLELAANPGPVVYAPWPDTGSPQ